MAYKPVQMKIQDMFGGEVILRMAQQKAVSIQVQLASTFVGAKIFIEVPRFTILFHFTSIELLVNIHVLYTGLYFPLVYFPFFTCKWFCSILISPRHSCVSREIILDIRNCPDLNLIADNEGKNKNGGKYFSVYSNKFLMVIITYSQSVYLLSRFNSPWTELKYK